MYLDRIAWAIVNEKELPVCGTSPNTMVSPWHKPCDAANTNFNFRNHPLHRGFPQNGKTHENSCLGKSAPLSPNSSITFCVGDACWKGRRLCSWRTHDRNWDEAFSEPNNVCGTWILHYFTPCHNKTIIPSNFRQCKYRFKSRKTCFGPNIAPILSLTLWLPLVLRTVLRFPCPFWLEQVIRTPVEIIQ